MTESGGALAGTNKKPRMHIRGIRVKPMRWCPWINKGEDYNFYMSTGRWVYTGW